MTAHVAPVQDDFRRCKLPLQQEALLPLPHALLSANPIICRSHNIHPGYHYVSRTRCLYTSPYTYNTRLRNV